MKIEVKLSDDSVEVCNIIKKYNNGDYQQDRKHRKRMELFNVYNDDYLRYKVKDKYAWIDVYLKDNKGYETAIVRRIE